MQSRTQNVSVSIVLMRLESNYRVFFIGLKCLTLCMRHLSKIGSRKRKTKIKILLFSSCFWQCLDTSFLRIRLTHTSNFSPDFTCLTPIRLRGGSFIVSIFKKSLSIKSGFKKLFLLVTCLIFTKA